MSVQRVAVIGAKRTALGRFGKGLSKLSATALGSLAAKAAISHANLGGTLPTLAVMGQVLQAGCGQNPARQAALGAGLPPSSIAYTVNMVCGSGLKAVHLAAQAIREGGHDLALAGGMESMSNAPYYSSRTRWGATYGDISLEDGMLRDGLIDAYSGDHMGISAEWVATTYGVSRGAMDAFAATSHQRALAARPSLADEIVPVEVGKGTLDHDENPRATDAASLSLLKPVFMADGAITAGNASSPNDGASALILASESWVKSHRATPLAWIHEGVDAGVPPKEVLMSPLAVFGVLKTLHGLSPSDFSLLEINEAFAVQMVALTDRLDLNPVALNPRGGAIALGHPIGCSGARLVASAAHQLEAGESGEAAFATLCLGGGNGTGLVLRRS